MLTTDIAQRISKAACIPLSDVLSFLDKHDYLVDVFEDVYNDGFTEGFKYGEAVTVESYCN